MRRRPPEGSWSARAEKLRSQGASEDTVESVRRLTAPARHRARVRDTIKAAHSFAVAQPKLDDHTQFRRRVIGLIAVDLIGVGGREGATGEGTTRLEGFQGLGSGRKRAGDGEAWMAAAEEALEHLCKIWDEKPILSPDGGNLAIKDTKIDIPPEWRRAVALRALARLTTIHQISFDGDDAGWCMVATHAQEQIRSEEP